MRQALFIFCLLLPHSVVKAEAPPSPSLFSFESCQEEKVKFCADHKAPLDLGQCLSAHRQDLSDQCKQNIERFIEFKKQSESRGGGALSSFGGVNSMGPPIPLISYEGIDRPGTRSNEMYENKLNISTPIYASAQETVALSLAGSDLHFGEAPVLNSGVIVPTELYRLELGAQYFHPLTEQRNYSVRGSVGSASDTPFKDLNDTTFSINANYSYPSAAGGFWTLSVFLSNNGAFANYVPIPGVTYFSKSEKWILLLGFPINYINWTPSYPWSFSLSLFGPTVRSEAAYGSVEGLQVFTGYSWVMENYLPNQRVNTDDRLTIEEMKVGGGLRSLLTSDLLGELQGGRGFHRAAFIGHGFLNYEDGFTTLPDDWFVALSLKLKL
jgi:hypothetical protein